jgi:hypothetical protein
MGGGGVGWSKRKFNRFEFQHVMWCVLDPSRVYFPFTKPGKTEEAASEFRKGTRKSTFWIPVKEPPQDMESNGHREPAPTSAAP